MDAQPDPHPTDGILLAHGLGTLNDTSVGSVGEHLSACPACRRRADELSPARPREARAHARPPATATAGRAAGGRSSAGESMPDSLAGHPDHHILRELERGGAGVAYLAENRLMGRLEVLKVIGGPGADRGRMLDRLLAEVHGAAGLQHPNIAAVHAARRSGDELVLALEHVEGFDLARVVKAKGPLPVLNACHYVHQVALGLQHAHERGLVHRNIEPGNLILASMGGKAVVKILDFGLSRASLSRDTTGFLAPEQMTDPSRVDIRADIYSLGCTLYFLLTGNPPFQGANLYDILQAHQSMDAIPLNLARPDVPVPLAIIAATMMAKEPERRFQTPRDVAQALAPFLKKEKPASPGSVPVPAPPGQSRRALSSSRWGRARRRLRPRSPPRRRPGRRRPPRTRASARPRRRPLARRGPSPSRSRTMTTSPRRSSRCANRGRSRPGSGPPRPACSCCSGSPRP